MKIKKGGKIEKAKKKKKKKRKGGRNFQMYYVWREA